MDRIGVGDCQTHQVLWWDARIRKCIKDIDENGGSLESHRITPALMSTITDGKIPGLYFDRATARVFRTAPHQSITHQEPQHPQHHQHRQLRQQLEPPPQQQHRQLPLPQHFPQPRQQQLPQQQPLASPTAADVGVARKKTAAYRHIRHTRVEGAARWEDGSGKPGDGHVPATAGHQLSSYEAYSSSAAPVAPLAPAGTQASPVGASGGEAGSSAREGVIVSGQVSSVVESTAVAGTPTGQFAPRPPFPTQAAPKLLVVPPGHVGGMVGAGTSVPVLPGQLIPMPAPTPGSEPTATVGPVPLVTYDGNRLPHQGLHRQQGQPDARFQSGPALASTATPPFSGMSAYSTIPPTSTINNAAFPRAPECPGNGQNASAQHIDKGAMGSGGVAPLGKPLGRSMVQHSREDVHHSSMGAPQHSQQQETIISHAVVAGEEGDTRRSGAIGQVENTGEPMKCSWEYPPEKDTSSTNNNAAVGEQLYGHSGPPAAVIAAATAAGDHSSVGGGEPRAPLSPRTALFEAAKASVVGLPASHRDATAPTSLLFETVRAATANDAAVTAVATRHQSRLDASTSPASSTAVAAATPPSAAASAMYQAARAAVSAPDVPSPGENARGPSQAYTKSHPSLQAHGASARLETTAKPQLSVLSIAESSPPSALPPTPIPAPLQAAQQNRDEHQATFAARTAPPMATPLDVVEETSVESRTYASAAPSPSSIPPSSPAPSPAASSSLRSAPTQPPACEPLASSSGKAVVPVSSSGLAPVHGSSGDAAAAAASTCRGPSPAVDNDEAGRRSMARLLLVDDERSLSSAIAVLGTQKDANPVLKEMSSLTAALMSKGAVSIGLDGRRLGEEDGVIDSIQVAGGIMPAVLVFDVRSLLLTSTGKDVLAREIAPLLGEPSITKVMPNVHDYAMALALLTRGEDGLIPPIQKIMDMELARESLGPDANDISRPRLSQRERESSMGDGSSVPQVLDKDETDGLQLTLEGAVQLSQSCRRTWEALVEAGRLADVMKASQMKADFSLGLNRVGWRRMTFVDVDSNAGIDGDTEGRIMRRLVSYELEKLKEVKEVLPNTDNSSGDCVTVSGSCRRGATIASSKTAGPTSPSSRRCATGALPAPRASNDGEVVPGFPSRGEGDRVGEVSGATGEEAEAKITFGSLDSNDGTVESPHDGVGTGEWREGDDHGEKELGGGRGSRSFHVDSPTVQSLLDFEDRLERLPSPSVGRAASRRLRTVEGSDSDGQERQDEESHRNHLSRDHEKRQEQQQRRQRWRQLNRGSDNPDACDADVKGMLKHLPNVFLQDALVDSEVIAGLEEVVLDQGSRPRAFVKGRGKVYLCKDPNAVVTRYHLSCVVGQLEHDGRFRADNTAGFDGLLHRVAVMRDKSGVIYGVTIQVRRCTVGVSDMIDDLLFHAGGLESPVPAPSILVLGQQGTGKTSLVRDICRKLSPSERVVIVDTRNDVGGDGVIPHLRGIGEESRRFMVPPDMYQHEVLDQAHRNHNPQTLVVDEITSDLDVEACSRMKSRGVRVVAGAVGDLPSVLRCPQRGAALGGLLDPKASSSGGGGEGGEGGHAGDRGSGNEESSDGGSSKKDRRAGQPVFDVVIEVEAGGGGKQPRWTIAADASAAVDELLASGRVSGCEMRMPLGDQEEQEQAEAEEDGEGFEDGVEERHSRRVTAFLQKVSSGSNKWKW